MINSVKKTDTFLLKLKSTPDQTQFEKHYWADYIELRCLFNLDDVFSRDDFLEALRSNKDFLPKDQMVDEEEISTEFILKEPAYINDREERFANNCFELLNYRIKSFKDYYPFILSSNKRALYKKEKLNWKNRCYIFLLLCSSIKYIATFKSVFTSSFEVFSLSILKNLLPSKAEAHLFGSSNSYIKSRRYAGHIWDKFNKLKDDLNEPLIKAKKSHFAPTNTGDGGFDFVAWVPNNDKETHLITFTGQSACTELWDKKQYSSSALALGAIIPISVNPINIVFIPFSIRNADGEWYEPHNIVQCVMLDRQRLVYHFGNVRKYYTSLPCDKTIIEMLKLKDIPYN